MGGRGWEGEGVDLRGEMRGTRRYDDIPGLRQNKSELVRHSGILLHTSVRW